MGMKSYLRDTFRSKALRIGQGEDPLENLIRSHWMGSDDFQGGFDRDAVFATLRPNPNLVLASGMWLRYPFDKDWPRIEVISHGRHNSIVFCECECLPTLVKTSSLFYFEKVTRPEASPMPSWVRPGAIFRDEYTGEPWEICTIYGDCCSIMRTTSGTFGFTDLFCLRNKNPLEPAVKLLLDEDPFGV